MIEADLSNAAGVDALLAEAGISRADAMLAVTDDEPPFSAMDAQGNYTCPHCATKFQDEVAVAGDIEAVRSHVLKAETSRRLLAVDRQCRSGECGGA